jgi:hypothetical protein
MRRASHATSVVWKNGYLIVEKYVQWRCVTIVVMPAQPSYYIAELSRHCVAEV